MLRLVARRAVVQWRLLAGVVALVTVGATVLGVCALLLSRTQDRAFAKGVQQAEPAALDVTAFLVTVPSKDARSAGEASRAVISSALAPIASTTTTNAVSALRQLGGPDRRAYLGSGDDLADRAVLTAGHWPQPGPSTAAPQAVVPEAPARLLHLGLGQRVRLGRETGITGVERPVTVVVVGTFRPRSRHGWERDPLSGKGFAAAYNDGRASTPTYGPFMLDDDALLASGSTLDALQVTGRPSRTGVTEESLGAVATSVDAADARLSAKLEGRARISRVASDLPSTVDLIRAQQTATRSTVLVVVLLGTTLAVAALLLAGRLLTVLRSDERALLVTFGSDRRQLLAGATTEAALLAAVAALLAVPASALAHAALTRLPALAAAGLTQPPAVTAGLVLTVTLSALLLACALVLPSLRAESTQVAPPGRGRLALAGRSGLDVLLLGLAAVGWWQVRSQPSGSASSGDLVRIVAPVLCVLAAAVVAVRCVPPLLDLASRPARRARALVLPLAVFEAARRPHAVTASVLLAVAAAASTFGLSLHATWERSQVDQAALQVGTDLAVALTAPPTSSDAAAVAAAAGGGVVSAVTARPVALGQFVGERQAAPELVAVDAQQAGALLRGRLDGRRTWAQVGAALAANDEVVGLPLPDGAPGLTLSGSAPAGAQVTAAPTLVVQDRSGLRSTLSGDPVPLDGRPHRLRWRTAVGPGQRLVAMELGLSAGQQAAAVDDAGDISVSVRVPGAGSAASRWTARSLGDLPTAATSTAVAVDEDGGDAVVRASTRLSVAELTYAQTDLLATAFEPPTTLPVAVSQQLADSVGTKVGGGFTASVGTIDVPVKVVAIVPSVPSAPGQVALLADADTLSRTLIGAGELEPVVDAWWVGHPSPNAARAVAALDLGDVTTRREVAAQLARGPLRVSVTAALVTLVVAAGLLLLAGTALLLTADLESRAVELARLRALGLTRREVLRLLVTQHGAVLTLLVVIGALVGAGASLALGPSLVRSDLGGAPAQPVLARWPWPTEASLVLGLVLGCLAVTALVAGVQVRRSDTAHLRVGDA
ncbi:FtsX-like permease family protein [Angustibacter sp. McL0619]|uniref:FtsX-like permease family protein n=1 Tax=Angustibacter sp. McL0619 TaxID=3415676 RepID=UPI003CF63186